MTARRALIGCEFGDNRGHVARCVGIANALMARGISVVLVIPMRFGRSLPKEVAFEVELMSDWNADGSIGRLYGKAGAHSMGDVLVHLGFRTPALVEATVAKWTTLIQQCRPDIVIADYAPNLLAAARGRMTTVSVGTGFTCPPSSGRCFPTFTGHPSRHDEADTLAVVNGAISAAGGQAIETLPALFKSDIEIVGTFRELDPYAKRRWSHHYALPSMSSSLPVAPGPKGDEIFVYSYNGVSPKSAFWTALTATGYPVRLYMQEPTAGHLALFSKSGIKLERRPLGFDVVAARSRMVLSHGGHGIIASSIVSGLPMAMGCFDMEKYLNGKAMERAKVGQALRVNGSKAIDMAEAIDEVWRDPRYAKAAIVLAARLKAREQISMISRVLNAFGLTES